MKLVLHRRVRSDEIDAHGYGPEAVEDVGGHKGAVLREGSRVNWGELQRAQVITICDHLRFLL
jgi:hypothetical protein